MNRFKRYLNEVGGKLQAKRAKNDEWFKGYLNEVGRKLSCSKLIIVTRLKGYLNEVGRKRPFLLVKFF